MALDLEGKVCPRHPSSPAVARCFACFKPICEICLVQADEHDFCSETCAQAHAKTDHSFKSFLEQEERQRRQRRIRRIIYTVVFIAFCYFAIKFWVDNPDTVEEWYEAAIGLYGTLKNFIMETIQGFTS